MSQGYQPQPSNKPNITNPPKNPYGVKKVGFKYPFNTMVDFFTKLTGNKLGLKLPKVVPKPKYLGSSRGDRVILELLSTDDLAKIFSEEWVRVTMSENPVVCQIAKPLTTMHQYAAVLLMTRMVKTGHLTFFDLVAHFKWQLKNLPNQSYIGHLAVLSGTLYAAHNLKGIMELSLTVSNLQAENEVA